VRFDFKNNQQLIRYLESSAEARQLLKWLIDEHLNTDEIIELRSALGEAISSSEERS